VPDDDERSSKKTKGEVSEFEQRLMAFMQSNNTQMQANLERNNTQMQANLELSLGDKIAAQHADINGKFENINGKFDELRAHANKSTEWQTATDARLKAADARMKEHETATDKRIGELETLVKSVKNAAVSGCQAFTAAAGETSTAVVVSSSSTATPAIVAGPSASRARSPARSTGSVDHIAGRGLLQNSDEFYAGFFVAAQLNQLMHQRGYGGGPPAPYYGPGPGSRGGGY
jgi:hypothetical protein